MENCKSATLKMGGSDCLFCATSFCWAAGAKAGGLEVAVWAVGARAVFAAGQSSVYAW